MSTVAANGWIRLAVLVFWSIRYRVYNRDLYPGLRAGRGSKENPLTLEDMAPVLLMWKRLHPDE